MNTEFSVYECVFCFFLKFFFLYVVWICECSPTDVRSCKLVGGYRGSCACGCSKRLYCDVE